MVYFTSDLHIGHNNIIHYRSKFKSLDEHNNFMIDLILSLNKRDVLYIIGDFLFDCVRYSEYLEYISHAKCSIKLVMGNHDSKKLYSYLPDNIKLQLPLFSYKNMWISHVPIHESQLRGRLLNIHGHMHMSILDDSRYFNVNIDTNGYKLVSLEDIRSRQINKETVK